MARLIRGESAARTGPLPLTGKRRARTVPTTKSLHKHGQMGQVHGFSFGNAPSESEGVGGCWCLTVWIREWHDLKRNYSHQLIHF